MIGVQKQQKGKTDLNQRRTPLNVVVEKIGTRAVVHGDLSKESLKELLMSELSLISKMQTPEIKDSVTFLEKKSFTQEISEVVTKGGNENISKKSNTQEEGTEINISREENAIESDKEKEALKNGKVQMKMGQKSQENDKDLTKEFQKGQDDIFKKEMSKKNDEDHNKEQKTNNKRDGKTISSDKDPFKKDVAKKGDNEFQDKEIAEKVGKQYQTKEKEKDVKQYQDKETVIEKTAGIEEKVEKNVHDNKEKETGKDNDVEGRVGKLNEIKRENRQDKMSEGKEIAKKSEKKDRDEETNTVTNNNVNKGTKTTKKSNQDKLTEFTEKEFDKKVEKEYQDKKQGTRNDQKNQKTKDIFQEKRRKDEGADRSVKSLFIRKDSKSNGRKFMSEKERRGLRTKERGSRYNEDSGKLKEIEKLSYDEDFIDYENEERESCFSKISSDQEGILELSYDGKWLRQYLKKPLILAMNEIIEKKPKDPVNYLGFWLLNYRNSQENLQRKRDFEKELLSKRNEWNVLQGQAEEIPELMIEKKESKHLEEEENIEDWNFSNYEFK